MYFAHYKTIFAVKKKEKKIEKQHTTNILWTLGAKVLWFLAKNIQRKKQFVEQRDVILQHRNSLQQILGRMTIKTNIKHTKCKSTIREFRNI